MPRCLRPCSACASEARRPGHWRSTRNFSTIRSASERGAGRGSARRLDEAAPRAGHARHYAVMVAERSIRQRLKIAGSRMAQAAESGDLAVALRQVCSAGHELTACRTRWLAFPEPRRQEVPTPACATRRNAQTAHRAGTLPEDTGRLSGESRPRGPAAEGGREAGFADLAAGPSSSRPRARLAAARVLCPGRTRRAV